MATDVFLFVSHPAALGLQSKKPALHLNPQSLFAQVGSALGAAGQELPQAPQLVGELAMLISQPFRTFPSQFPKVFEHCTVQFPFEHPARPFERLVGQWFVQLPHVKVDLRFASQPSVGSWLQSRKNASH